MRRWPRQTWECEWCLLVESGTVFFVPVIERLFHNNSFGLVLRYSPMCAEVVTRIAKIDIAPIYKIILRVTIGL